jgi:acetyl esterase
VRHPYIWLMCRLASRLPTEDARSLDERRSAERAAQTKRIPVDDGLVVVDHQVPVTGGSVLVRSYRVAGQGPLPTHVLLHGGGFWTGSVDNVDWLARYYAVQARCLVLSVDYRLAPEYPWPTANEDAYSVLLWAAERAEEIGVDPTRLSIGGVSAGGGIAAVVAIMARDRGGPALRFQLIEIPTTDLTMSQPSMERFATGYVCTRAALLEGYEYYVPDAARRSDPAASPLFAEDLSGLPPAMVITCQYDPLRDEGEAYARRLAAAGTPAVHVRAKGLVHSTNYLERLRPARLTLRRAADALAEALHA